MMYSYIAAAALAGSVSGSVLPRTDGCCFQLTASGGKSGTIGQLGDGQNRIGGGYAPATYCIQNGEITDSNGRGCILTPPTTQLQCDVGATPTKGFSISGSGEVDYNGSGTFYACGANTNEYNLYTKPVENQKDCYEVKLSSGGKCAGNGGGGGAGQSSSAPAPKGSASASVPASAPPAYSSAPKESAPASAPPAYSTAPKESTPASSKANTPPAYSAPAPSKPAESKPVESKPAPSMPAYSAPAPSKPAESKPVESKPVESKPVESKPVESKPVESKPPVETMPSPAPSKPPVETMPSPAPSMPAMQPPVSAPSVCPPAVTVTVTKTEACPSGPAPPPVVPGPSKGMPSAAPPASSSAAPPVVPAPSMAQPSPAPSGSAPAPPPKPSAGSSQAPPPAGSGTPASGGSACQTGLTGAYQTPHLIVPISSDKPDVAQGTSYFGEVSSTTSTIFNFDVPAEYAGKQCSIVFLFPEKKDLTTADYTFSGSGSLGCSELSSVADQKTSYSNAPAVAKDLGDLAIMPGNSYVVATGDCKAGTTQSIELSSKGGLSLHFFEDYNPSPLGLFMTSC